jgi:hypothetical protein
VRKIQNRPAQTKPKRNETKPTWDQTRGQNPCSLPEPQPPQIPPTHQTPPPKHVEKGNDDGLYISSVACCQELWALIMDAGTGFTAQVYSLSSQSLPKVLGGGWEGFWGGCGGF